MTVAERLVHDFAALLERHEPAEVLEAVAQALSDKAWEYRHATSGRDLFGASEHVRTAAAHLRKERT